jgi:hypothetical protein
MQLVNVSFDNNEGDAIVDLVQGTLQITLSEKNPAFPSGATISIPLDPLFQKLQAQAPNLLVKWGEEAAQDLVDDAT